MSLDDLRREHPLQPYVRQLLEGESATLTVEEAVEQARSIAACGAVTAMDVLDAVAAAPAART